MNSCRHSQPIDEGNNENLIPTQMTNFIQYHVEFYHFSTFTQILCETRKGDKLYNLYV